jgi:hypothetical protein
VEEGLVKLCVDSSSRGLYIVGRGAPLPLPKAPREAAMGGAKGSGVQG